MATGSGLDAQLVAGQETTWGTAVTPTRAVEFNSENMQYTPTFLEPAGLRVGTTFKRASRVRVARTMVSGDVSFDLATLGMGMFVRQMLGSATSTTTALTAPATKQVHTPGGFLGLSQTLQVGRPQPIDGVVKPFTWSGMKITKWEFTVKDNGTPALKLTYDGQAESTATALVTPAYLAGTTVFAFSQASVRLGGTVTTTSGVASVSGGTQAVTILDDLTLDGTTGMAVDRFGLGNGGLKAQQLQNAIPTITGKFTGEFNATEFYNVFKANTTFPIQFTLTGDPIGASGSSNTFDIILPACKIKTSSPNVSGPDLVKDNIAFEVYSDEVNAPIQITIISADTTV
jgi:hypothetical protein